MIMPWGVLVLATAVVVALNLAAAAIVQTKLRVNALAPALRVLRGP